MTPPTTCTQCGARIVGLMFPGMSSLYWRCAWGHANTAEDGQ